jgi:DNA-binding SARP family transcriptional activator
VDFKLLGPLEVRDRDQAPPLGGRRQRALLAALLLHANEVVSRDRLIDQLWGEHSPEHAGHRLESQMSLHPEDWASAHHAATRRLKLQYRRRAT